MNLEEAVRGRRTHKAYGPDPVDRHTLNELFELARWAPNHHLTNPWRFRVVGPQALEQLKCADGDEIKARKFDRAPTLVAVSCASAEDATEVERQEDLLAAGCATYAVLLGATARGIASYWRTPKVLTTDAGRAALGIGAHEQIVGLLHLGTPRQQPRVPDREAVEQFVTFLD